VIAESINNILSNIHIYGTASVGTGLLISGKNRSIGTQGVSLNAVFINGTNIGILIEDKTDFITI
jgi:hypothetical protein